MADYYFDSSGLAKRYVNEPGSGWVRQIVSPRSGHSVYTARITGAEIVAALALRSRTSTLTPGQVRAAIVRFRRDFARGYALIDTSAAVVEFAMALAERYELRGYDAVQLGSALFLRGALLTRRRASVIFVSADVSLNAAATAEGLIVLDPASQP